MSSSSSVLRARKFSDSLVILRNRLNRACRSLYSRLSLADEIPDFDTLFKLCTESSFVACKILSNNLYVMKDDFPADFYFTFGFRTKANRGFKSSFELQRGYLSFSPF